MAAAAAAAAAAVTAHGGESRHTGADSVTCAAHVCYTSRSFPTAHTQFAPARSCAQVSLELGSALGPAVDAWALGVALYQLVFAANPFATPLATLSDRPHNPEEANKSSAVRELLGRLLLRDPRERCAAGEACKLADVR